MKTGKRRNGVITLGVVGLLMVTAVQMTSADHGESATVIIGTESYPAECFDGGSCIIPGEPVNVSNLDSGKYIMQWTWYSFGFLWADVVSVQTWTTGCTGNDLCEIKIGGVQGNGFEAECFWLDGESEWTGHITVNGDERPCYHAEFNELELVTLCRWDATVRASPLHSDHFGEGAGYGYTC